MSKVQKAIAIYDAKIQFVSLVDKAANLKQFLVTKQADGEAQFSTYSKILKIDQAAHYITGIVYEPMAEDAHGNYMTEDEIRKAAYWFAKNGDKVDLQHSFESADGLVVVENYVAPCDMTIGDTPVVKGTWVLTVECSNEAVWQAVKKGKLTGFSMGGFGKYSEEDVALEDVTKAGGDNAAEKTSLFKRLGKFLGLDLVEKGEVMDTEPDSADVKAVSLPVSKTGRKMSGANKAKLDEIFQAFSAFKSAFDESEDGEDAGEGEEVTKKEEHDMNRAETEALVNEAITKALTEAGIRKAAPAASEQPPAPQAPPEANVQKQGEVPAGVPAPPAPDMEAMISKAAENAVKKVLLEAGIIEEVPDPDAPVTKAEIEQIVSDALAPMMKAFSLPQNLNDARPVEKGGDVHYLHGLL